MTQNTNPFAQLFSQNDFFKTLQNYQSSSFDMKTLMELQRKNLQALTEAQQVTVENLQVIAQKQGEILTQMMSENSTIAKELMSEGTPEEKAAKKLEENGLIVSQIITVFSRSENLNLMYKVKRILIYYY